MGKNLKRAHAKYEKCSITQLVQAFYNTSTNATFCSHHEMNRFNLKTNANLRKNHNSSFKNINNATVHQNQC